ncbi:mitochondrial import inner membrane translocase subunit TIM44-like isoform X2 [Amphibalanus amphitrite]|nr:mitochondrial import inner membrane translocase subunit TIM44-like isoform X2 [Amphibalanus amphitrite]XP_043235011.1 mitochondrial import inner membrane translocase subunit TIM44-like isoform X2 [Amphibalanus amphitrite]XP_043235012.1 mitochondrial import inner membrane translocase subunit TIM44-like isoform X2 [Amphibalanus amphitrite]XP_043235014.1 mitochondrial import inner membrane translocase subunit TIM44-like isoform X2 [Amphibalanus amphitrite]XP_043235015.1 mitochondrial import inn
MSRIIRSCRSVGAASARLGQHEATPAIASYQRRHLSGQQAPQRPQGFIGKLIDNIKQEYEKNKEMKESLEKFKKEAEKLEQSEALKKAREKYERLESETGEGSKLVQERLASLKKKLGETIDEAQKLELIKKATQLTEAMNRQARQTAEGLAEKGEKLGKSATFQTLSDTARAVKQEIDDSTIGSPGVYRAPKVLRKRKSDAPAAEDDRVVAADSETTGVELHKDSRFYASWQNFKDNNAYVHKVMDWKTKYDESDNAVLRASKLLTEKVSDIMGGLFQRTELSEVLTEICKMDPTFEKDAFLRDCEHDIIPNILEAMIRGDLDVLQDWCYEATFNVLAQPIRTARQLGYHYDSKVLDVDNVDLAMGKMMDQGPVLIITFTSQQILCVRDAKENVIEGDPNKIMRVNYVWVLCRDQTELDPRAAWRLLELSASSTEQLV